MDLAVPKGTEAIIGVPKEELKGSGIFLEGLRTMVSMHFNGIMLKKPIFSS
jgi:hypothetical protein